MSPYCLQACEHFTHPQLVVLFGKAMEPLGGGVLLKEVHHWRLTLKVYSLAPFAVLLLFLVCGLNHSASHCWADLLRLQPCPPCYDGLLPSLEP